LVVIALKNPIASGRCRAHGLRSATTEGPRPATTGFARGCAAGSLWHAPAVVSASKTAPSVTLRSAVTERIELFERRNGLRIVALVVLATLNSIIAVLMAAIALGIGVAVAIDHLCELAGPARR
jgi:hypothetical protein